MIHADLTFSASSRRRKVGSVKFLSEITPSNNKSNYNDSSKKEKINIKPILKQAHSAKKGMKSEGDKKMVVFTEVVEKDSPSNTPTATTPGTAVDSQENIVNMHNVSIEDRTVPVIDSLVLASHSVFDPTSIDSLADKKVSNFGSTNSSTRSNLSLSGDCSSIVSSHEKYVAGNKVAMASIDSITMTASKTDSALVSDINMYKSEIKHIKHTIKDLKRQQKSLARGRHRNFLCNLFSRQD